MLFDLYGDFAIEGGRSGAIRLRTIARLAPDLDVSDMAARAAATRMVRDGWLAAQRRGRESVYELTTRGRQLVEEGRRRIFAVPTDTWDGTWHMVALSVPETRREVRDGMRKALSWLGFGSPSNALYVHPYDRMADVLRLAQELDADDYLQMYQATVIRPVEASNFVAGAWHNLHAVNQRYAAFIDRFADERVRVLDALRTGVLDDRDAFKLRFTLANQFRRCLFDDPDLPSALLPVGWRGRFARQLFLEFHELVTPHAVRYFDTACSVRAAS
jgi:phenylacetic acid degradation operon negative regulatory protein